MKNKRKKNNPKKELYSLYALIFIPMLSFLFVIISKIVIEFNVLIGTFMKDIAIIFIFLEPVYLVFDDFIPYIKRYKKKRKKQKTSFNSVMILLIFGGLIIYFSLDLIDAVKDCFQGTKEIYIEEYKIREIRVRKGPDYDVVIWYDEDGNKYELDSYEFISDYDDMGLKIKYYENLGVIESFEYIEK